ncbi:chromate transporter [Agaricicola taiwanensis]|uniref:Chromate transporter n=2 Tax=Agaricicola taiwanensis TaxID=591372 RepID=A0A8J2YE73_9RHOB|nr:chromate transporter [Agaricicola taiwanensis]
MSTITASEPLIAADDLAPPPTLLQLFIGFGTIGLYGFGGVLPWARWMLVEKQRWLAPAEFIDLLSLCQFLPGANIVNLSTCVGVRFHGFRGALVCFIGLMAAPVAIVLLLVMLYDAYGHLPAIESAFKGVSSAAAGLILGMAIKIGWPYRKNLRVMVFAATAIVAVVFFKIPLIWVLAALLPTSMLAAWVSRS